MTQSTTVLAIGLAIQTLSLFLFIGTHFWFTLMLSSGLRQLDPEHAAVYESRRFKHFLMGKFSCFLIRNRVD